MEQYISKSALVAEIEKRKHRNVLNEGAFEEDIDILYFLDTLEVKEVDSTDAFIEKACEFLAGNMKCDGYTLQTKAKFIRGFRNYMKGE